MLEVLVGILAAPSLAFIVWLILFPLLTIIVNKLTSGMGKQRIVPFALVNLIGAFCMCVSATQGATHRNYPDAGTFKDAFVPFAIYLLFVSINFFALLKAKGAGGSWGILAMWLPIFELVLVKYIPFPPSIHAIGALANPAAVFLGLSYVSFRLCYLVQEVLNNVVEAPTFWEYVAFAFFIPTLSLGPISPYRTFIESFRNPDRNRTPVRRSLERVIVGLTKYLFFSTILGPLTYSGLILDGHQHGKADLLIAILVYPMYLYCNFSGLCDVAIGTAGLIGISVAENFDNPFSSRNFQVFWSKWHMTLSNFMREMVFTPLVKALAKRFGSKFVPHAVAIGIMTVFVLIGIWHGATVSFVLFGLSQGLGVCFIHYSTDFLKRKMGKKGFADYRQNRLIYFAACGCTYGYFALTMILFANTWEQVGKVFQAIH